MVSKIQYKREMVQVGEQARETGITDRQSAIVR